MTTEMVEKRHLETAWASRDAMAKECTRLREALAEADKLAEAGLCYFTLSSAREFLKDVRRTAKKAGVQGGLTEFKP